MATFKAERFADFLRSLDSAQKYDDFDDEKASISNIVSTAQIGNFDRESDETGNPWAPRKADYPHPPLRDTLKMYAAATDPFAEGSVKAMGFRSVTVGIDDSVVPYAKYQQFGTSNMPARKFFYLREQDYEKLISPFLIGLARVMQDAARAYASSSGDLTFSSTGKQTSASEPVL